MLIVIKNRKVSHNGNENRAFKKKYIKIGKEIM
jgi:hypothetical protein